MTRRQAPARPGEPKRISITTARVKRDTVMRWITRGEVVHITRRGVPVVEIRPVGADRRG